jgi:hypothetical protein
MRGIVETAEAERRREAERQRGREKHSEQARTYKKVKVKEHNLEQESHT